jgi:hypothetical protein
MEDPVKRWLPVAAAAACLALANPAAAQFTAAVVPPPAVKDSSSETRRGAPEARSDSAAVAARQLSDLREWVDSAALAVEARPTERPLATTPGDTLSAAMEEANMPAAAPARTETVEFRNGAIAPSTASPLPLLALLGVGSLLIGIAVRRW